MRFYVLPIFLTAALSGCAVSPQITSENFGSRHTVRASSIQEGREAALKRCWESDRAAYRLRETVSDRGDRKTYLLEFTCKGYSPNPYAAGG